MQFVEKYSRVIMVNFLVMFFFNFKCLFMLLSFACHLHPVWGQQCQNETKDNCNLNLDQELIILNNCSKCVCRRGYYQHVGLDGCRQCQECQYPYVTRRNCTPTSNTECVLCEMTNHFHTKSGCQKCQKCEHGTIKPCGNRSDAVCAKKVTTPTSTTSTEKSTTNAESSSLHKIHQVNEASENDWRRDPIWHILFIILASVIAVVVVTYAICQKCRRRLYVLSDSSSMGTSLSSLMFTKSKLPDITSLTDQERRTPIRELPGGYAEQLGHLLNPNGANNWVQLACEFGLTLNQIANLREKPDRVQDLLLYVGTRNTTVEMLWRALKNVKRDDACITLINCILELRKDNESAILIH